MIFIKAYTCQGNKRGVYPCAEQMHSRGYFLFLNCYIFKYYKVLLLKPEQNYFIFRTDVKEDLEKDHTLKLFFKI